MNEFLNGLYNMETLNNGLLNYFNDDVLVTDVYETKDNIVLEIEVPGVKKENIEMNVEKGTLTVKVRNKFKEEKRHFLKKERFFDYYYQRQYTIGNEYSNEDITASLNDGLLTVLLPKEVKKIENKKYIEIR